MRSLMLLLFLISFSYANDFNQSVATQEIIAHGKQAYTKRCVGCHGEKGDGNGPATAFLNPKPRDFTSGIFKFKSTPIGTNPTDKDLMHTLSKGVMGVSMPSYKFMPEQERFAVIQYIKTFSDTWDDEEKTANPVIGAPMPIEDFRDHNKFIARAKRGRGMFIEACVLCHGLKGQGDGESGQDLEDDWGQKILPANLTKAYIKGGKSARDIYRVLLVGYEGTPMVSFKDTYDEKKLWDLTAYVLYLRGQAAGIYGDKKPIKDITAKEAEEYASKINSDLKKFVYQLKYKKQKTTRN
jgi:cytochrome c oxidase cbb3-type subunit I/II